MRAASLALALGSALLVPDDGFGLDGATARALCTLSALGLAASRRRIPTRAIN